MYGNSYGQLEIARGDTLGMGEFGELEIAQNFEGYGDFGNPFGLDRLKMAKRRRARVLGRCKRKNPTYQPEDQTDQSQKPEQGRIRRPRLR